MNRSSDSNPDGNPHIKGGNHPKCEQCGSKVVPNWTSYGVWYSCKNCGYSNSHGSTEQVS